MVICLEQGADLHMAQLVPLPLTVSCFSKIQIGFAFLVPAHPGSPGQRAVKRMCVCVCVHESAQWHLLATTVERSCSGNTAFYILPWTWTHTCYYAHLRDLLPQCLSTVLHLLFLGFLLVVDAATVFASTAAVSRSAADTALMSKLTSCEQ